MFFHDDAVSNELSAQGHLEACLPLLTGLAWGQLVSLSSFSMV